MLGGRKFVQTGLGKGWAVVRDLSDCRWSFYIRQRVLLKHPATAGGKVEGDSRDDSESGADGRIRGNEFAQFDN